VPFTGEVNSQVLLHPTRTHRPADGQSQVDEATLLDGQLEEILRILEDEPGRFQGFPLLSVHGPARFLAFFAASS
jgi:hypothetical protein